MPRGQARTKCLMEEHDVQRACLLIKYANTSASILSAVALLEENGYGLHSKVTGKCAINIQAAPDDPQAITLKYVRGRTVRMLVKKAKWWLTIAKQPKEGL